VTTRPDLYDENGYWSSAMTHWQPVLLRHLSGVDVYTVTIPRN
jgi:hypothetical protein